MIVRVDVPRKITSEQRELLTKLAESLGDSAAGQGDRGLFSRLFGDR